MSKQEFKIDFIEGVQEFTNEEMGEIVGGLSSSKIMDCGCRCIIFFVGTRCGCNVQAPKATYNSCPCECKAVPI